MDKSPAANRKDASGVDCHPFLYREISPGRGDNDLLTGNTFQLLQKLFPFFLTLVLNHFAIDYHIESLCRKRQRANVTLRHVGIVAFLIGFLAGQADKYHSLSIGSFAGT
ncbi:MAG: hypothetical protein PHY28_09100 [Dehalococcoidales bacterium]|nr:hypothetical protein [Dehalococcoidales bacterium]